jgi:hypothetical protein
MNEERQERERADRNRERSEEAHWRAAEAGAEEEDESPDAPRRPDEQQDDWENEGGSLDRESGEAVDESADDPR